SALLVFLVSLYSELRDLRSCPTRRSSDLVPALVVVPILFCGIAVAVAGINMIVTQHRYYRRTVHKKTLFEELLGLWEPVEGAVRSEEHTSELQLLRHLVCCLVLEKKN